MKKLYMLTVLAGTFTAAVAQPTLPANHYPAIGDVFQFVSVDSTGINEGASGANVTWNFSTITPGAQSTQNYVDPSTTPNSASYPAATIATENAGNYQYFNISGGYLNLLGLELAAGGMNYTDPQHIITLPFTYQDNFSDAFSGSGTISGVTINRTGSTEVTGDAYGTLIMPGMTFNDVVRVKTVDTIQDNFSGFTSDSYLESYAYYSASRKFPVLQITHNTNVAFGTTTYNKVVIADPFAISGVKEYNTISVQLFPNPSNEVVYINGNLKPVDVTITDLQGKVVMTERQVVAGTGLNIAGLASGLYVVTFINENGISTTKLVRQ